MDYANAGLDSLQEVADAAARTPKPDAGEELLRAARAGDRTALQRLCSRCLPALRACARRLLPRTHAGLNDADDLVQIVLLRALNRLGEFEIRGGGSFLAYLRQILLNEVQAELRRQRRRGESVEFDETQMSCGDLVLEHVLGRERECTYLAALRRLNSCQRRHLALRIEGGLSFGEIAAHTGSSEDGARMRVARAIRAITEHVVATAA
jgi:RNA polymerase sigma-70 factor (ECF subfamily)